MWWKNKHFLLGLCLPLMLLTFFSQIRVARAEEQGETGFIIEADRVVGKGMTAMIIKQETADRDAEPMLRIFYQSAVIYGMKLTKKVETPSGPLSITLKAGGPVSVTGMTVDTTAISFKGSCLKGGEVIPELGMEDVVMVAHYMKSEDSILENLLLKTVSGNRETKRPGKLKLLKDLGALPLEQLDKEIERIGEGHLPLTCEDRDGATGSNKNMESIDGKITDALPKDVDVVTKPIDKVTEQLNAMLDPVKEVADPIVDQVIDPITTPIKEVLDPVLDPVESVTAPVGETVSDTAEKVDQTLQSACSRLGEVKGVITKELALDLINEALEKKVPLSQLCKNDSSVTTEMKKWEESLLQSLGLINLLGKLVTDDPVQQLTKMREKIQQERDGTIIFSP